MNKSVGIIIGISMIAVFLVFVAIFIGFADVGSFMFIPFMMPVAVFVMIVVIASKRTSTFTNMMQQKTCSNCGSKVMQDAKYCPNCGESFSTKIICDYCGAENEEGEIQCHNCNALL